MSLYNVNIVLYIFTSGSGDLLTARVLRLEEHCVRQANAESLPFAIRRIQQGLLGKLPSGNTHTSAPRAYIDIMLGSQGLTRTHQHTRRTREPEKEDAV